MRLFLVDAFADRPFTGNPAAVCLLDREREAEWMQSVAAEMNQSETAFVRRQDDGQDDGFELRWFTPATEVDLCGHATLASAHVLWAEGVADGRRPLRFHTLSGPLTCARAGDLIELNFPATPAEESAPPAGLVEALGVQPTFVGRSRFDQLLVVESEEEVRSLKPDFARLRQFPMRGAIVTSPSVDPRFDFVSRFFAPAAGIDEDPVTGSAHCCLGPYWSARLGKTELAAFQASSRGGVVKMRIAGERVFLSGRAVTFLQGELPRVTAEDTCDGAEQAPRIGSARLLIRDETGQDHSAVGRLHRAAFGGDAEADLCDALRAGGFDAVSLVAQLDADVVGHILFEPVVIHTEAGRLEALSLAPMAVAPQQQRRGIGAELVRAGLAACRAGGHQIVVVLGHAEFYPRFGFSSKLAEPLESPFGGGDAWMALELTPNSLAGVAGRVEYPPPFRAFE